MTQRTTRNKTLSAPPLSAVLLVVALVFGGCGDDTADVATDTTVATTPGTTAAAGADTTSPAGVSEVKLVDSSFGKILADGDGNTLYLFTPDTGSTSTCSGGCADTWPPLTGPAAGDGIDADDLATSTRDDGSSQVTFYGHPVYRYAADSGPGTTNGQGVGGKWYVIDAEGNAVKDAADPGTTATSKSGY